VPAILTAITLAFFPIVRWNVETGLATTEPELEDVRSDEGHQARLLFNVGLPRTMPYFLRLLKVAGDGSILRQVICRNRGVNEESATDDDRKFELDVPLVFRRAASSSAHSCGLYVIFSLI